MSQHLLKGKVAWLAQRFLRAAFIGRTARKTWRWLLCKMDLLRKGCFLGLLCTGVFALIMRFCEIRSSETAASRNSYMVTVRNCVFSMPWLLFALGLLRRGMLMPWCLELNGSFFFCWAHQTTNLCTLNQVLSDVVTTICLFAIQRSHKSSGKQVRRRDDLPWFAMCLRSHGASCSMGLHSFQKDLPPAQQDDQLKARSKCRVWSVE